MISETAHLATEAAKTAADSGGVLGTLGINGKLFLAQLVNFGIVVLVMWKWVYTPLVKMMDKRSKEIVQGLEYAKLADKRLSEAGVERERILQEARAEMHALLEDARARAEILRQEKLAETKTEIEKVAIEAKDKIRSEREAAYGALQRDIANLVALAIQKVAAGMDEKAQRDLIDKTIKELERA
jgi:F-type H+-transporting ATPase subunit b